MFPGLEGEHRVQGRLPPKPYRHSVVSLQHASTLERIKPSLILSVTNYWQQKKSKQKPLPGTGELFCPSATRWDRDCSSSSPAPPGFPWTASRLESIHYWAEGKVLRKCLNFWTWVQNGCGSWAMTWGGQLISKTLGEINLFSGAIWFQWASAVHNWEVGESNQLPAGSHVFQQVANKLAFSQVRLDTSSFAGWTCPPMSPTSNWETSWSRWNDGLSSTIGYNSI